MNKLCEYCGTPLNNTTHRFCNSACRGKSDKARYDKIAAALDRQCECCGKRLTRRLNSNGIMESIHKFKKRKFCNVVCAGRSNTNRYTDIGDVTHITTVNGDTILIDKDMKPLVSRYCWAVPPNGKSVRSETRADDVGGDGNLILLSHLIMPPFYGGQIDHINKNPLDNRRNNLRRCTNQQNCCNRGLRSDNSTGYKGVGRRKGRLVVRIGCLGKRAELLYTDDLIEAAQAYNIAAKILHGEFSRLNNVPPPTLALQEYITEKVNRLFNTGGFIMSESGVSV